MKCRQIDFYNTKFQASKLKNTAAAVTAAGSAATGFVSAEEIIKKQYQAPSLIRKCFNLIQAIFPETSSEKKLEKKKEEYKKKLNFFESQFVDKNMNIYNTDVFEELINGKNFYALDYAVDYANSHKDETTMLEIETVMRNTNIEPKEKHIVFKIANTEDVDLKSAARKYESAVNQRTVILDYTKEYKPKDDREENVQEKINDFYTSEKYFDVYKTGIHTLKNIKSLIETFPESDFVESMLSSDSQEKFDLKNKMFKYLEESGKLRDYLLDCTDEDCENCFQNLNQSNFEFAQKLIETEKYEPYEIDEILKLTTEKQPSVLEKICLDEKVLNEKIKLSKNSIYSDHTFLKMLKEITDEKAEAILKYYELENKGTPLKFKKLINLELQTVELAKEYDIPLYLVRNNTINKNNADFIAKLVGDKLKDNVIEEFAEHSQKRQERILLETLYDDERFDLDMVGEIYNDVFFDYHQIPKDERKSLPLETFNDLMDIVNCKELKPEEIHSVTKNIHGTPKTFHLCAELSRDKSFDKRYFSEIKNELSPEKINIAEELYNRKNIIDENDMRVILSLFDEETNEKDVLDIITSGKYHQNPWLTNHPAKYWRFILETGITEESLPMEYWKFYKHYAKTNNPKIFSQHKQLIEDAFTNRNILKYPDENLYDEEIWSTFGALGTIYALNLLGVGNLEALFPEKIYEFQTFCENLYDNNLNEKQLDSLMEKINPSNTKEYHRMLIKQKEAEKELDEFLSDTERKQIKKLKKEEASIKKQIKTLKLNLKEDDKEQLKEVNRLTKEYHRKRSEIQKIYYNNPNSEEIFEILKKINAGTAKMKKYLEDRKSKLTPQETIDRVQILTAFPEKYSKEVTKLISIMDDTQKWNTEINKKVFETLEVPYSEKLSKKLDLIHSKHLSKLLISLLYHDEEFTILLTFNKTMEKLVNLINNNIEKPIEETIDSLPQNQITKSMYEKINVDYDKLTKFDKNSFVSLQTELDSEAAKQAVIKSLEEDLNDDKFNLMPDKAIDNLRERLKKAGFEFIPSQKENFDEDGFYQNKTAFLRLYKSGKPINFPDAVNAVNILTNEMNQNEFWSTKLEDQDINNAREFLYNHIVDLRNEDIKRAKSLKGKSIANIEIRKVDMYDIKKALSLGNDAQCCTALGAISNEWTAPNYIMNKCVGAIEITDNGKSIGNTMFYLAYIDGKPALVLDNIELKTKYQFNNNIRDGIIEYAKKLCTEIGRPDLEIYAGPNRHKVDFSFFEFKTHSMEVIGDSGQDKLYFDYDAWGHTIGKGITANNVELYKLS